MEYQIILKERITDSHCKTFAELLREQGKVKGDLNLKVDRCIMIAFVFLDGEAIGCGGIKEKTQSDFLKEKANLPDESQSFDWELGYIFTKPAYSGKGIASTLISNLITEYGNENLMASTEISANPGMVRILEKNGFRHYGTPWKSKIHSNYLGLFLKYK
ncbi:MAG: GNAT family N-acetyltransferase [Salinivirgaceae bacterium]|nr:GNAT family N-acetyltransferase [Salinivirgaceae bacterium]